MIDYALNIIGSEWIIIIFVALILLFGTNKLPEAGKKIGKIVGEYNKAKTEMQNQIKEYANPDTKENNMTIDGPVQTERQKLEYMAKSLGINIENKTDSELKQVIESKFGTSQKKSEDGLKENKFKN
ncbi:MAG: twin-arginine translocase TatA/TatE family subunit [Candidatus Nitrosopelagicus sp.]|nr:twin-arginine translocase TatA/TatE family subunit [Candidatus Nitrosopelagicus sp.]